MCFAKQPKKRELRTCSKAFISLISSEAHQTRASHLQSSTQDSWAHACACMAASVNICGSYLCTLLSLKIHERCSPAAAAPSGCVEAAGTGTAAWSLQRHRFLFKKLLWHLNSSDLAPISTLWSRTQLAGEQVSHPFHARAAFFLLSGISESIRVSFSVKRTNSLKKICQITATLTVDNDMGCKQSRAAVLTSSQALDVTLLFFRPVVDLSIPYQIKMSDSLGLCFCFFLLTPEMEECQCAVNIEAQVSETENILWMRLILPFYKNIEQKQPLLLCKNPKCLFMKNNSIYACSYS